VESRDTEKVAKEKKKKWRANLCNLWENTGRGGGVGGGGEEKRKKKKEISHHASKKKKKNDLRGQYDFPKKKDAFGAKKVARRSFRKKMGVTISSQKGEAGDPKVNQIHGEGSFKIVGKVGLLRGGKGLKSAIAGVRKKGGHTKRDSLRGGPDSGGHFWEGAEGEGAKNQSFQKGVFAGRAFRLRNSCRQFKGGTLGPRKGRYCTLAGKFKVIRWGGLMPGFW